MLHAQRAQWEMAFANSGAEALALLASRPFDVVVTDMRMPAMDGAELLRRVREQYPDVIRIVLSGYFETEAALRAVGVAHQFLANPASPKSCGKPSSAPAILAPFCPTRRFGAWWAQSANCLPSPAPALR
jgi:CheY-like chemotaxis protein